MGSPNSAEGFSEIINNPVYATSVGFTTLWTKANARRSFKLYS